MLRVVTVAAAQDVLDSLLDAFPEVHVQSLPSLGDDVDTAWDAPDVVLVDARATGGTVGRLHERGWPVVAVVQDDRDGVHLVQGGAQEYLSTEDLHPDAVRRTLTRTKRRAGVREQVQNVLRSEYRTRLEESVDKMRELLVRKLGDRYREPLSTLRDGLAGLKEAGGDAATVERMATALDRIEESLRQTTTAFDVSVGALGGRGIRFDLAEIVTNAADAFRRRAQTLDVRLDVAVMPGMMHGDPEDVASAVESLLSGAIRAASGSTLTVRLEAQVERLILTLEDDAKAPLKEPADAAELGALGGADLEHFIARRVVEAHGGTLRFLERGEGRNPAVCVELPRWRTESGASTVQVLHVEDDADDRAILQAVVRRLSMPVRVHGVASLAAARDMLAEGGVDIVFLDLELPDSPHEETLRVVDEWSQWLPVVTVTGQTTTSLEAQALAAGSRDFIHKSRLTERRVLASLMRSALASRNIMRALRPVH